LRQVDKFDQVAQFRLVVPLHLVGTFDQVVLLRQVDKFDQVAL
jgi:hypothetical protein